jgi:hypothetical protein
METQSKLRNEKGMTVQSSDRSTAIIVGVLFIFATAFSLASTSLTGPILGASNYLASASANQNQMIAGVLLLFGAALSVVLIPAMVFPVLRRHNEGIALGYLALRIVEGVTQVLSGLIILILLSLGQEYVNAGSSPAPYFQSSVALLVSASNWEFLMYQIIFGFGALIFYYLLYRTRLIPAWLSAWGLLGAALVLGYAVAAMFRTSFIYLAAPIAVQEMALAVWLIVKGFNPLALHPRSSLNIEA